MLFLEPVLVLNMRCICEEDPLLEAPAFFLFLSFFPAGKQISSVLHEICRNGINRVPGPHCIDPGASIGPNFELTKRIRLFERVHIPA